MAEVSTRETKFKGGTYRVRSGDNLFDIARRFGTTVSALLAVNNMKRGAVIRAGQKIRLSGKGQAASPADEAESHSAPAVPLVARERAEKASGGSAVKASEIEAPRGSKVDRGDGGSVSTPTAGKFGVHTVSPGESLYSITRSLGVSEDDLRQWNNLKSSSIQAGQKLKYQAPRPPNEPEKTAARGSKGPAGDKDESDGIDDREEVRSLGTKGVRTAALKSVAASGPKTPGTKEEKQYYVVKPGDSLWDISVKYRTTVQKIKDLNGRLPTAIMPGTRIRVK